MRKKAVLNFVKMKTFKFLLVIASSTLFIASCKKNDEQAPLYMGYNYFPVNVGHELYYDADSIITDEFTGTTRSHHFQIKEVIDSAFTDAQNRPSQRIERYVRDSSNSAWVIFKVWSATLTTVHAERYEDNTRYVKLVFPVAENVQWNGNSMNTNNPLDYQYTEVNASVNLNNASYDSVLTVLQWQDDNLIDRIYFMEQYTTNVGLIYKENIKQELDFNTQTVKSGYIYKETLTSYTP